MRALLLLLVLNTLPLMLVGEAESDKLQREYQKQDDKLARQSNPIKRAKILIKMSQIDMKEVALQVQNGDLAAADEFLKRYIDTIERVRQALKDSQRNARKNPSGFKEFEISLRKQLRQLEDFRSSYSFDQRELVDKAIQTAQDHQQEMLGAIFGLDPANLKQEAKQKGPAK
ncbi:MAG: hypothetical protein AB1898_04245 [Acidobacteriota bacterium]